MPETLAITDRHLIQRIEREQQRRDDKRPTQTATTLLIEYLTLLENRRRSGDEKTPELSEPSAA